MLPLMKSQSTAPNENFVESVRNKGETNKEWLRRHWDPNDTSQVVLVGGISPTAQRIRIAQSHSRHDFTPSLWSHVGLLIYDQKQDVFTCFQAFPLVETMPLNSAISAKSPIWIRSPSRNSTCPTRCRSARILKTACRPAGSPAAWSPTDTTTRRLLWPQTCTISTRTPTRLCRACPR